MPLPAFADNSQVIGLNNDGVKALNANNYQLAIQKFEAALKLDPTYTLARDNLAIAHNNYGLQLRNNPVEALKQFHQALYLNQKNVTTMQNVDGIIRMMGKNPKSAADRMALGQAARNSSDFYGAIIEYQAAAQIKDDPKLHVILGDIYRVIDDKDKAIAEYQAAARLGDSADVEVKLGQAYQAKKDIPNAIAAFGKAIAFKSDDAEVQDALVAGWEEALKENPLAPDNHIGLGQAFQYRGDFGQAEEEFKQAIRFSPGKQNAIASRLLAALPEAKRVAGFSKHVNAGVDLQSKKLYDQAIAEYKLALQVNPKSDEVWVNIGTAYQAKSDFDSAIGAYQEALKINGGNQAAKQGIETAKSAQKDKIVTGSYEAGGQLFKQGNFDGAITKFLEVLKYNPNDPATLFSLGASYQAKKDFDNAIASYQKAIAADPKNADYQKALAGALELKAAPIIAAAVERHKAKDYDGAIAGYTQALSITPNNAGLWYNIASAEYAKQEYGRAKAAYLKALGIDAKGQVADLYLIGAIDENYGKGDEARVDYQKYLAQAPTGTYAGAAKERLAALNKNISDTLKIKSEAQMAQEKDADDSYQQAVKLQQAKQYDAAIPLYQKALGLQPNNVDYVFGLGTLYQAMGKLKEAAEQYQKAIPMAPTNKDLPKYLAQVMGLQADPIVDEAVKKQTSGDIPGAIELYKQAITLAPDTARIYTNLGIAYQQSDQWQPAYDAYKKAYSIDAKNEIGDEYLMGQLDENFGKGSQALSEYQNYLRQAPVGQYAAIAKDRVKALSQNPANVVKLQTQGQIAQSRTAAEAYDAGVKLQQANKLDEALVKYQAAQTAQPNEAAYAFAIGTVYQAKTDWNNAATWYQKAKELDPKNKEYQQLLTAAQANSVDAAAGPVMQEAITKQQAGDLPGAIQSYLKALQIAPNNARGWTNLASAYQQAEDFSKARDAFQKALTMDPKGEADNSYYLAILDENAGNAPAAIADYQKYIQFVPKGQYVVTAQGRLSDLRAHPANTQKIVTAAQSAKSGEAQTAYDAAVKAQTANNLDEALTEYNKAIAAAPNEPSYYYSRGTAYQAKNELDKAIDDYRKAFSINPKEAAYKQVLSAALAAKAAPLVDSAIKKQTGTPANLPGAIADYEAALKLSDDAGTHTNLGTAYQAVPNLPKALENYKKAIQIDPKAAADAMYYAATVYEAMKQIPNAIKEYQNYLRTAPTGQFANDAKARIKALGGH